MSHPDVISRIVSVSIQTDDEVVGFVAKRTLHEPSPPSHRRIAQCAQVHGRNQLSICVIKVDNIVVTIERSHLANLAPLKNSE